jgi:excinuclease UvrABC ATPase subunit
VGLHPRDIERLKRSVRRLRDAGNTVLLVEHHPEMIRIADHVVDLGPGPGIDGGRIQFEGSFDELLQSDTATGHLVEERLPFKATPRTGRGVFRVEHATLNNLQDLSADFPLGVFGVVAGVAGSGKSSLMECFRRQYPDPEQVIYISQKNIGVSLRSTPGTYMDVAGDIRKAFAKAHKLKEAYFTFNGAGACPVCGGRGVIVSEMAFMDAIETTCEACGGLRYKPEALQYKLTSPVTGETLDIAQTMDLSVRLASRFFAGTIIEKKLRPLVDVGLQYLHLNQALSTLSGGELQRLKLASYLGVENKIFIVDEPTDGLHIQDIRRIIALFDSLVERGNTVYMIEHNLDVIRSADYLLELGPGAGEAGGRLLYAGAPAGLRDCPASVTRTYLLT